MISSDRQKSTALNDVRVANRDPEKYPFYRVLGVTRFYTAKSRNGAKRIAGNLAQKLGCAACFLAPASLKVENGEAIIHFDG
jgi:hypothetical protein